jgi:hypothetical protein
MRALILGARGAVGRRTAEHLEALGHAVTRAGRDTRAGWARLDLASSDGWHELRGISAHHDVVINATGVEDPRIVDAVAGTLLVEISATAGYLEALDPAAPIVLGAGLAPGLSTIMLASLGAQPGDELDLAVMLGGGEAHGAAAVAWTADLAGRPLHRPPERRAVYNLREGRTLPGPGGGRRSLRADFPDHLLLGEQGGYAVRTYLATDRSLSTTALWLVGRIPRLRSLVRRAPHLGGDGWSLTAQHRRTGQAVVAHGRGQSNTTALLTAHLADAAMRRRPDHRVTAADLLTLAEVQDATGIQIEHAPAGTAR